MGGTARISFDRTTVLKENLRPKYLKRKGIIDTCILTDKQVRRLNKMTVQNISRILIFHGLILTAKFRENWTTRKFPILRYFFIVVGHVLSLLWQLKSFHILITGKVEIGIYFCVTADILTKVLLKYFWSSPLPTI